LGEVAAILAMEPVSASIQGGVTVIHLALGAVGALLLGALTPTLMQLMTTDTAAYATSLTYASLHTKAYNAELLELVRIPSVSSLPAHAGEVKKAAGWVAKRLQNAGFENVVTLPTVGNPSHPNVYGDWLHAGEGAPTILIYGHFDVQPVDPLDKWKRDPFDAALSQGRFLGRGASDDKGGLLSAIQGAEAVLAATGGLPVNVKWLLEGSEEIGSPSMPAFVKEHKARLACDYAFSADGSQPEERVPGILLGLRGAAAVQVDISTAATDLHSGMYGGAYQNAVVAAAGMVAALHHPNRSVSVPGFYANIPPPSEETRADIAKFPFTQKDESRSIGALGTVGEEGYSTLERKWVRPTLEVVGMSGGFTGEGVKTVLPSRASFKIVCRLVPGQDPRDIVNKLVRRVEGLAPAATKVTAYDLGFSALPYDAPKHSPSNRVAADVLEALYGREPVYFRSGGSIPVIPLIWKELGVYTTVLAFGLADENLHAPNEFHREASYHRSREAYIRMLFRMAEVHAEETSN